MPDTMDLTNNCVLSPDTSQSQSQYPNFSRPQPGRKRSYSTGLPFQYNRGDVIRSLKGDYGRNDVPIRAHHATTEPVAEQRPRSSQTKDDGMLGYPQKRKLNEEHHWAEKDVNDAFQRWVLSEKTSKKLKQPYYATGDPETQFLSAQPEPRKPREKGPIYEKVDGVQMDTKPANTDEHGMEITLPEIEARDVREIPERSAVRPSDSPDIESERGSSSASSFTVPSSAASSGISPQLWSESSQSSSTASTENSSLRPYQHISKEYVPVIMEENDVHQQSIGSLSQLEPPTSYDASTDSISELGDQQRSSSMMPPARPVKVQKLPLDDISEESQDVSSISQESSDAAPAPIVKGVTDEEVTGKIPKTSTKLKQGILGALDSKFHNDTASARSESPPRVVATDGIGGDMNVYEFEAAVPLEPSTNQTHMDTAYSSIYSSETGSDKAAGSGLLGKVEHGISKAAHALHDKVRKNVTFSPVNDVRFMTPSPHPSRVSMDSTGPNEVEARQWAPS